MRRALRWVRRLVLGVLALTIVVVGLGLILVHTDWGREQIRRKVEASLQGTFPGGVKIGRLDGSVFGELVIRDVEIASLDGKPAITVKTVRAELAVWPLIRKIARVDKLVAEDVTLVVGTSPVVAPSDHDDASPTAWSVALPDIAVHRARVSAGTAAGPITLDELELAGDLALPTGMAIQANVRAHGTWRERKLPVELEASVLLGASVHVPVAKLAVGDVKLAATELAVDPSHPIGMISITGSAAALSAVEPSLVLPADAQLTITIDGPQLVLDGALGSARLAGRIKVDLPTKTVSGIVGATGIDAAQLTSGKVIGRGEASVAFEASPHGARGVIAMLGAYADLPAGQATVHFDAKLDHADVLVLATSDGDARAYVRTTLRWHDRRLELDSGRLVATVSDAAAATGGRIPITGALGAELSLVHEGSLVPLELALRGHANGRQIRYDEVRVGTLDVGFGASLAANAVTGSGDVTVTNVWRAGSPLGSARVHADYRPDGRIWTQIHATPAAAPLVVELGASITPGEVIDIALAHHTVKPATGATWHGTGGRVSISERAITITGLTTTNGEGKVELRATLDRLHNGLDAKLVVSEVPLANFDPTLQGKVSGTLAARRSGGRWDGAASFAGSGLVFRPDVPALDSKLVLGLDGRHVHLDVEASSPSLGRTRFELAFDGPRDVTDVAAWRALDRPAMTRATLTVDHVNLAAVTPTGGMIDGTLVIAGADTHGTIEVTNVQTPVGTAAGQVSFSPRGRDLFASWDASVTELGKANVGIELAFPDRPLDPAAWKALGAGAVRSLSATVDDLAIDPARLARLGIDLPLRGHANLALAIGNGVDEATLTVNATGVEGGVLARPLDAHLVATTSSSGTTASACLARSAGKDVRPGACGDAGGLAVTNAPLPLLELAEVRMPVTFTQWIIAPRTALAAPITGKLTLPVQDAPAILAVLGRHDFVAGTLEGAVTVDGTLGKPTGRALFTARNMSMVSTIAGRSIPTLQKLEIDAKWLGADGALSITAEESNRGKLRVNATGRPDRLATIVAGIGAENLDLAPIAAFLPGPLAASSGTLRGALRIASLDPATRVIRGDLHLRHGNIPIAPIIGTLREAEADVALLDSGITIKAKGALGAARVPNVSLDAKLPEDLSAFTGTLALFHVAPLAEIEPIIDGTVDAQLRRSGTLWTGTLTVKHAHVVVPPRAGDDLLDADAPDDIYDVEKPPDTKLGLASAREPVRTWLDASVVVLPTPIEVEEYGVRGSVRSRDLRIAVGDTIGLRGKIVVEYGVADDIFGRQYRIEPTEAVSFDGTIDPEIDLRLVHEFPSMVLTAMIQGRLSAEDFPHLEFEGNPRGKYGSDQLFAFFAGADPESESTTQTRDAAANATASVLSGVVAARLKRVLPGFLKFDVLKYEPGTSAASATYTVGRWTKNQKGYIAVKSRFEPFPNENAEELEGQYYLTRAWIIDGVAGNRSHHGLDLLWRSRW
jgi:hypothetical protein